MAVSTPPCPSRLASAPPPGARGTGDEKDAHRPPPARRALAEHVQQVLDRPRLRVVHDEQQSCGIGLAGRRGVRRAAARRGSLAVPGREHLPAVLPGPPGELGGQPGLALPARPVQQQHGFRVPVAPRPEPEQLVLASGEGDGPAGRREHSAQRQAPRVRDLLRLRRVRDERVGRRGLGGPGAAPGVHEDGAVDVQRDGAEGDPALGDEGEA
ncbi:hypothetical protein LUX33_28695 [Actinomadura madurae]|uniref:hypothetical protein n=1 Tax=Actinomadura madurae TaxID=1993 RepID=UPI0020D21A01|nr:hypothetical protein [Actinomadura madurae]MCP9952024.1 hypothetical protein [Actinomadura madurae]